jgi:predicted transposase/invertase (TIGR01784 family)
MSRKDAVGQAIDYCIENNYIRTYLEDHKPEVVTMLDTEWDFDTAIAVAEEEGMERGVAKGRMEGKVEGILQTAKKMKDDGLSIDAIQKYTGLTVDDIIRL